MVEGSLLHEREFQYVKAGFQSLRMYLHCCYSTYFQNVVGVLTIFTIMFIIAIIIIINFIIFIIITILKIILAIVIPLCIYPIIMIIFLPAINIFIANVLIFTIVN